MSGRKCPLSDPTALPFSADHTRSNAMKKIGPHRNDAGFSLLELFIVLIVVGVLVTLAVLGFGASASSLDRQNIAREFKVALERARYDSVKRRPSTCDDMSRVEILSKTSFRLLTDTNRNGVIEPAVEASTFDFTGRSQTEIVGDASLVFPITIRFDGRGSTSSGPCAATTDAYASTTFCETPCTIATASPQYATVIYVSPTGTTALLAGGESIATVDPPAVSTVSPSVQINPLLAVWNAITGGTPTPSPTPTLTPTPDPDPSPTGTPDTEPSPTGTPDTEPSPTGTPETEPSPTTPTPSPTSTPLPFCRTSPPYDRPGSPATCLCQYPMVVSHSGKCEP